MHIWIADKRGDSVWNNIFYFDSPHWNSFLDKRKGHDFLPTGFRSKKKINLYGSFELLPELTEETKNITLTVPVLQYQLSCWKMSVYT